VELSTPVAWIEIIPLGKGVSKVIVRACDESVFVVVSAANPVFIINPLGSVVLSPPV
jgi:hypothetical protein